MLKVRKGFKEMDDEIAVLLEEYGQASVKKLKREVRISDLIASQKTINSISYSLQGKHKVLLTFSAVLNILDRGRKKGQAPPSSRDIMQWMDDKGIQPRANRKAGRGSSNFARGSLRNKRSSAFMIAKAISRNGTIKRFGHRGAKIFKKVRKGSRELQELKNGIQEITRDLIKTSFNQLKSLR